MSKSGFSNEAINEAIDYVISELGKKQYVVTFARDSDRAKLIELTDHYLSTIEWQETEHPTDWLFNHMTSREWVELESDNYTEESGEVVSGYHAFRNMVFALKTANQSTSSAWIKTPEEGESPYPIPLKPLSATRQDSQQALMPFRYLTSLYLIANYSRDMEDGTTFEPSLEYLNEKLNEIEAAKKQGDEEAYEEGLTTREMKDGELVETKEGCHFTEEEAFRNAPHTAEDVKKRYERYCNIEESNFTNITNDKTRKYLVDDALVNRYKIWDSKGKGYRQGQQFRDEASEYFAKKLGRDVFLLACAMHRVVYSGEAGGMQAVFSTSIMNAIGYGGQKNISKAEVFVQQIQYALKSNEGTFWDDDHKCLKDLMDDAKSYFFEDADMVDESSAQAVGAPKIDPADAAMEREFKINEQCFLLEHLNAFTEQNKLSRGVTTAQPPSVYKNFKMLREYEESTHGNFLGYLLARDHVETFMDLTPSEYGLLVPKIRISKLTKDGDGKIVATDYPFQDYLLPSSVKQIMKNQRARGMGAGIKSFSLEEMNSNEADQNLQCKLELFFQSPDMIMEKFVTTNEYNQVVSGMSYGDMFFYRPDPKNPDKEGDKIRQRAEIGWSIPDIQAFKEVSRKHRKPKEIETLTRGINNATTIIDLYMTGYDMSFNDDGTLSVSIEYRGALEQITSRQSSDLIMTRKMSELQKRVDAEVKLLREDMKKIDDSGKSKGSEGKLKAIQKEIKELYDERDKELEVLRAEQYTFIIQSLKEARRGSYSDKGYSHSVDGSIGAIHARDIPISEFRKPPEERSFGTSNAAAPGYNVADATNNALGALEEAHRDGASGEQLDFVTSGLDTKVEDGKQRIHYMFLGDILETMIGIAVTNGENMGDGNLLDELDILLGAFNLNAGRLVQDGQRVRMVDVKQYTYQLADIPISLSFLVDFLTTELIKPQVASYSLRGFMKKFLDALLSKNGAITECFANINNSVVSPTKLQVVSIPSVIDQKEYNFDKDDNGYISQEELRALQTNIPKRGVGRKYIWVIYSETYDPTQRKGDPVKDASRGVYHLYYGADKGIVKTIQYKKEDVEYAKEARMTGEVDSSSQMRGEYFNANVQMIGNGIFSSGQVVYLNPRTGGMSAQDAEDLGLGGYYMVVGVTSEISGENFSTDIGLRYLSARQREEKDA